ncbi:MAG: PQQ-binding-like beta-propeller repeat protein [Bradymonadaceae bacterium]
MPIDRRFSVSLLLLIAGLAAGCAGLEESGSPASAYETEPVAKTPNVQIQWRRDLDYDVVGTYRARQWAAPGLLRTSDRRELFVGSDSGWLYRMRAGDGEIRWERELNGPIHATPVATASHVYVGTLHGDFYAINRQSGETDWKIDNSRAIESDAAVGGGLVFYTTNAGQLVALDEASGEKTWTYNRDIPKEFTVKGSGTPVVVGNTVYCGFADGTVAALDATTGRINWEANVAGDVNEFTDVDLPVIVRGDRVYDVSYGAGITALDRKTGEAVWSREYENISSASFAEDRFYLTIATGRVIALDAEGGTGIWGFKMSNNQPVDIKAAGSYLFVSTGNGPLYILDRSTGYPLRKWRPSPGVNAGVTFSKRAGYMLSNKGYLYSFRLAF